MGKICSFGGRGGDSSRASLTDTCPGTREMKSTIVNMREATVGRETK